MKIDIENYNGWQISFDTDDEVFYCHSDKWDREQTKNSFSAVKKWIDDFIKDNQKFTPVWAETLPSSYSNDRKIKIIGIRKDGDFIYEDSNGEKKRLSDYNIKDYIIYDPANDKFRDQIKEVNKELEVLHEKKKSIEKKITGKTLLELRNEVQSQ